MNSLDLHYIYNRVLIVSLTLAFIFLILLICCLCKQTCSALFKTRKRRLLSINDEKAHIIVPDPAFSAKCTAFATQPGANEQIALAHSHPQSPFTHITTSLKAPINNNNNRLSSLFQRGYLINKWPAFTDAFKTSRENEIVLKNGKPVIISTSPVTSKISSSNDQLSRKCLSLTTNRSRTTHAFYTQSSKSYSGPTPITRTTSGSSRPLIEFALLFREQAQALDIQINCIRNLQLPSSFNTNHMIDHKADEPILSEMTGGVALQVKITLNSTSARSKLKPLKTSLQAATGGFVVFESAHAFQFNQSFDQLRSYTLRLALYARKAGSFGFKRLIGDVRLRLDRPDFTINQRLLLEQKLCLACPISGKRLSNSGRIGELGYLKIGLRVHLIQRESIEFEICVNILGAESLPVFFVHDTMRKKFNTLSSESGPVNLLHEEQSLDSRETQLAFGKNAQWNQQFTFYVNTDQLEVENSNNNQENQYLERSQSSLQLFHLMQLQRVAVQLIVMKGRVERKDATIGQVKVGYACGLMGKQHWLEMCVSDDQQIIRWHELQSMNIR